MLVEEVVKLGGFRQEGPSRVKPAGRRGPQVRPLLGGCCLDPSSLQELEISSWEGVDDAERRKEKKENSVKKIVDVAAAVVVVVVVVELA